MRYWPVLLLVASVTASSAFAQQARLTIAVAEKMAAACSAYAEEHKAAVNIWIFDEAGALVHFQRMDGAPPVGAPEGSRSGSGMMGGRFDDPTAFNANALDAVPVLVNGRAIGAVRATGMGVISDRACARAAADAGLAALAGR